MESIVDWNNTVRHALSVKKGESIAEAASRVLASEIESEAAKRVAGFISAGIHDGAPVAALHNGAAAYAIFQQI